MEESSTMLCVILRNEYKQKQTWPYMMFAESAWNENYYKKQLTNKLFIEFLYNSIE